MALTFRNLHPVFVGEASPIELARSTTRDSPRSAPAWTICRARLRDQPFEDAEQLAFAQRLDGKLPRAPAAA
jgi:hypothetical protein